MSGPFEPDEHKAAQPWRRRSRRHLPAGVE